MIDGAGARSGLGELMFIVSCALLLRAAPRRLTVVICAICNAVRPDLSLISFSLVLKCSFPPSPFRIVDKVGRAQCRPDRTGGYILEFN